MVLTASKLRKTILGAALFCFSVHVIAAEQPSDEWLEEEAGEIDLTSTAVSNWEHSWVEGLLHQMSLAEKIGQMFMIDLKATELSLDIRTHLEKGHFGNIILFERNLREIDQVRFLNHELQTHAFVHSGIPMLIAVDQEGGLVDRLGGITKQGSMRYSARTIGAAYRYAPSRAIQLIKKATGETASRMKDLGFNMNMAPVLDLTNDKHSYIYSRSFGGEPEAVSRITKAYAETMKSYGIIPTGKHFPNLSMTRLDSHKTLPQLNRSLFQLQRYEFVPFKRLHEELPAMMMGHVLIPSIDAKNPASLSPRFYNILRHDLGFKGVIVSDDLKMRALTEKYSLREIILRSVYAGVDLMILASNPSQQLEAAHALMYAVNQGYITQARINDSVRRILLLKSQFAR